MERIVSLLFGCWLLLFGGPSSVRAMPDSFFCPPRGERNNAYAVPLHRGSYYLPIFASHPPGVPSSNTYKHAIIVMHGAPRAAMRYFRDTLKVVEKQNRGDETVVIAPAIPNKPCPAWKWSNRRRQQVPGDFRAPFWNKQREWMWGGGNDRRRRRQGPSSFDVLDSVVDWTQESYPNLDRVVVTGFSAGGQFVLRWAVMSPEGANGKTRFGGLDLRIIIGSPSTVLYLTEDRPKKVCRLRDRGQYHSCNDFYKPFGACHGNWDRYGFGLTGLHRGAGYEGTIRGDANKYMHRSLTNPSDPHSSRAVSQDLRERFATKDVRFVFGSKDRKHCLRSRCSDDCGAMLQGKNRLQRGLNYMGHLKEVLPNYKPKYSIFYGGHSNYAAFLSHDWILWALPYNHRDYKVLDRVVKHEGHEKADYDSRYFAASECMSRCENNHACNSFTYNPFSGHCDLFNKCVTARTKMVRTMSHEADDQTYYKPCSRRRHGGRYRLYEQQPEEVAPPSLPPSLRRPHSVAAALLGAGGVAAAVLGFVGAFAAWRKLGRSVRPFEVVGSSPMFDREEMQEVE